MPLFAPSFSYVERRDQDEYRDSQLEHYLWTPYNHVSMVYSTGTQAIANNTTTAVTYLTVVEYDPETTWASSIWTAPFSGIWRTTLGCNWEPHADSGARILYIVLNTLSLYLIDQRPALSSALFGTTQSGVRNLRLMAGDTLQMGVLQSSGGSLNLASTNFSSYMQVEYASSVDTSLG